MGRLVPIACRRSNDIPLIVVRPMMTNHRILLVVTLAAAGFSLPAASQAAADGLAEQAHAVLKKHCYRCHGVDFKVAGLNVLDVATLTPPRKGGSYVVLGDPDKSYLWHRVGIDGDMPPPESPDQPSLEEREVIKQWIAAS